jgi:signal transduction histidine kinase
MRLADFIETRAQEILKEWEAFAATRLPAASGMNALELRDHAPQILQAIAADLRTAQTVEAQMAKSQGRAPVLVDAPHTAAQVHGIRRAQTGFDISQMVSEYRALRASVLHLWRTSGAPDPESSINDIIRFNDAIDQAIAESVVLFTEEVERGRNLFLGVLGHELRNPLNAIHMTAHHLARVRTDALISEAAERLIASGGRMKALLDDLLEFSRTKLSLGLPISPVETDLAPICTSVLREIKAADPTHQVQLRITGDVRGKWDPRRLHQVLTNLAANALTYRAADTPVWLEVIGSDDHVTLTVRNQGTPIARETLHTLFDPLKRGVAGAGGDGTHLGLGLFVAREIVRAHHGDIEAQSDVRETVFTVHLPKHA